MEPLYKLSFVIAVTDLWDLPATVVPSSYGVRCLLHSHHLSSMSISAGPTSSFLCSSGSPLFSHFTCLSGTCHETFTCQGSHHRLRPPHQGEMSPSESCRLRLVLCPTFLLLPFSLETPTHSRSGPQGSLLPSRDLCGPAMSVTASHTRRPTVPTPLLKAGLFNYLLTRPQQI